MLHTGAISACQSLSLFSILLANVELWDSVGWAPPGVVPGRTCSKMLQLYFNLLSLLGGVSLKGFLKGAPFVTSRRQRVQKGIHTSLFRHVLFYTHPKRCIAPLTAHLIQSPIQAATLGNMDIFSISSFASVMRA